MDSQQNNGSNSATKRQNAISAVIVRWLQIFDRMPYPQSQNRKPLTEQDYDIYTAALGDLPEEAIDAACEKYMQEGKWFPLPANIREMIAVPEKAVNSLIAEEAWNAALTWVRRWYLGVDMGFDRRAPELDEKQRRGIIAAGGFDWVSSCSLEKLIWAKKEFIEKFNEQQAVEESGNLIGRGEASNILKKLRAPTPIPNNKALPAALREHGADGPFAPDGKPDKSIHAPIQDIPEVELLRRRNEQIEKLKAKGA
jgi:hypothetical protein